MRRGITTGVMLAIAMAVIGCDGLASPSRYGTVIVEAHSRQGEPIPGVNLLLFAGPRPMGYASTDSLGRATFERVPEAYYGVFAEPVGEWLLSTPLATGGPITHIGVAVRPDSTHLVRFVLALRNSGTISVLVRDDASVPLPGVAVTLYDGSGVHGTIMTDAEGRMQFGGLAVGEYGVIVRPPDSAGVRPIETYHDALRIAAPGATQSVTATFTRKPASGLAPR